jgi:hypothetical protein
MSVLDFKETIRNLAMRRKNRGITLIGFVMMAVVAGIFIVFGAKVGPMYIEFRSVKAAMLALQQTPGAAAYTPFQVWDQLDKKFAVAYVYSVKQQNVYLQTGTNGKTVRVYYEVRKPLVYNLEVVATFDHSVPLRN